MGQRFTTLMNGWLVNFWWMETCDFSWDFLGKCLGWWMGRWENRANTRPGKRLHNYGQSQFFMGKSTIFMAIFNSYVKLPEGSSWMLR